MQQTGMANFSQSWQQHWHHKASNFPWHVTATLVDACQFTCLQSFGLLTVLVLACQWNSDLLIAVRAAGYTSSPHCMCCSQHSDACPNLHIKRIVMQVTWWCVATANRRSRGGSACLRRLWMRPPLPLLPGGSLDGCWQVLSPADLHSTLTHSLSDHAAEAQLTETDCLQSLFCSVLNCASGGRTPFSLACHSEADCCWHALA